MKLRFIVLKVVRYSDTQSILAAYSRELGRVSFVFSAGSGKSASRMKALLMPLGLVECDTEVRPGRDVLPLRQARALSTFSDMRSNPIKQMMSMFLAEVLSVVLRDSSPDVAVYDYIEASARCLDALHPRDVANFHICFLVHIGRLLGIEPDVTTYVDGAFMDMRDGIWRVTPPLHSDVLAPEEAQLAVKLSRITYANMTAFKFTRESRARTLDVVLRYYTLHVTPLNGIRSLEILRSMF